MGLRQNLSDCCKTSTQRLLKVKVNLLCFLPFVEIHGSWTDWKPCTPFQCRLTVRPESFRDKDTSIALYRMVPGGLSGRLLLGCFWNHRKGFGCPRVDTLVPGISRVVHGQTHPTYRAYPERNRRQDRSGPIRLFRRKIAGLEEVFRQKIEDVQGRGGDLIVEALCPLIPKKHRISSAFVSM